MVKDGYDLGILIRLKRWNKLSFRRVMGELISEVGWLKGSYEERDNELEERLNGLIDEGLITREDHTFWPKSPKDAYYIITDKGRGFIKN